MMQKRLGLICMLIVLLSCNNQEEVIESTWPDGSEKQVVLYEKQGDKKKKITETAFYENGNKQYTGNFNLEGKREGRWAYWYKGGQLWSECDYKAGLRHGKSIIYYENGQKRYEGQFTDDNTTGIWNFWDASGNLENTLNYSQE